MLVGRQTERARIEGLLGRAREGRSGALVVHGEPGIGKTSLLAYATSIAGDMAVAQTRGVESEAELPYGGLLDVCRPLLPHLADLPPARAETLRVAFSLESGESPDRLAVGAATLALLATAAERRPLLVLVDDAHWVDERSMESLLFAARRLDADAIAILFAFRDGEGARLETAGLAELLLRGLSRTDAAALFDGKQIAPSVADRLYAITGGNPLALVEVPTTLTGEQLSGAEPLSEPLSIGTRLEQAFRGQIDRLEKRDQAALVVAAASGSGDLGVLIDAVGAAGLDAAAFERAEDVGLVRLSNGELQFRHPLVRSAMHQTSTASQRRRAQRALADAFAHTGDEQRAAWHAAAAVVGRDSEIADRLEAVGRDNVRRAAHVAAADAYERAAQLTEQRDHRQRRLLAAAESFATAGHANRAASLLDELLPEVGDERRGELLALRGQVEHASGDTVTAYKLLLEAGDLLEEHDPERALNARLTAFHAALEAGAPELSSQVAARLRRAATGTELGSFFATLLSGVADVVAGEAERGVALIRQAISNAQTSFDWDDDRLLDWLSYAEGNWGLNDCEQARGVTQRGIDRLRAKGNVAMLQARLSWAAWLDLCLGRLREAEVAAAEALSLARASGNDGLSLWPHVLLSRLGAIRGEHDACIENATQARELMATLRRTQQQLLVEQSLGLLALGEGRFDYAVRTLTQARSLADTRGLGAQFHALRADLVEALLRSGRRRDAAIEASTITLSSTPNDRAVAERAHALVDQDGFETRFRAALDWHERGQDAFEEARTQFCFGERLRRERRRREAREHLRDALATFDLLGARPWAERAQAELRATGEHYRRRDPTAVESLTPQELQVALQVAEGKANRDVASTLFLSTKTVEFHLTNVYRKVNVRSRTELARLLAADGQPVR